MRILASLLIGLFSGFFLGQFLYYLGQKFPFLKKIIPIHHSLPGILILLLGLVSGLTSSSNATQLILAYFMMGLGAGLVVHHLLSETYFFSERIEHNFVRRHENAFERFLEILPGALTWIALTSPIWLSFTLPFAVAYLIIIADVYWLINSLRIAAFTFLGWKKLEEAKKQNWLQKLKIDFPDQWDNYYHLLVLPTYKEGLDVLVPAFEGVANSDYPKEKIFLAVGFEEREYQKDPEKIDQTIAYLKKLDKKIGGVFCTIHPFGLPGEVPGPGTNRNWMITHTVKEFQQKHIKPQEVLVTTLDADFIIHPQFLAGALHKYLDTPANIRDKRSFTGSFLYYNNYWQTPTPMRLIAVGTALWQLAEMYGSDKYMNFSSLSINMRSLLDIGLWIPNKVNDDSGFFWKAYFHFKGDYKVIPHYLPITGDAVQDVNLIKTFQNQYLQQKRWAYGVEHVPYIVRQYFKNRDMSFWDKTDRLFFALWGYLKWGTLALFITFASQIIPLVNPHYTESVVAYNLPVVSSWVLTLAFIGMFSTIFVHEKTAPPRPVSWSIFKKFWSYIQWLLVPLVLVTISTIPAVDAQTSLMLGHYLEFRVTNKSRQSETEAVAA
ncbi:glycosyltransferase family 2 protein [Patescibacteria group bacterium]|nr:glycosyltransferase family 2 protein [Patescibacteria group bacterium]